MSADALFVLSAYCMLFIQHIFWGQWHFVKKIYIAGSGCMATLKKKKNAGGERVKITFFNAYYT